MCVFCGCLTEGALPTSLFKMLLAGFCSVAVVLAVLLLLPVDDE
jgi:hypothetical protein